MKLRARIITVLSAAWIASAVHAETVTVSNTDLMGPGSFAAAIDAANADSSPTEILFNIAGGGSIVYGHHGWLPAITTPVDINGANAGGVVTLVGMSPTGPGAPVNGLEFEAGSAGSEVSNITTAGFLNAVLINTNNVNVVNSRFKNSFARSIAVENSSVHKLSGNTFEGTTPISIQLTDAADVGVINNMIKAGFVMVNGSDNVFVGTTSAGNTFDNSVSENEAAVIVTGLSNNVNVLGNTFKNLQGEGVKLVGAGQARSVGSNTFTANKGWDIRATASVSPDIYKNTITGDNSVNTAGIIIEGGESVVVRGNELDGARISLNGTQKAAVGSMTEGNVVKNDTEVYGGSAAIILTGVNNSTFTGNELVDNGSNGIVVDQSSNNLFEYNTISGNDRSGIKLVSGIGNEMKSNVIFGQRAYTSLGVNSISLLGTANDGKVAPLISSVVRNSDGTVQVSGTGTPMDRVELFKSSKGTSELTYDALAVLGDTKVGLDSTWTATVSVPATAAELYVSAIATDGNKNSSELAAVQGVILNDGVAGPDEVVRGYKYTYNAVDFANTNYTWHANADVAITGDGTSSVDVLFNCPAGTVVTLVVGYSDPEAGWVSKSIDITVK